MLHPGETWLRAQRRYYSSLRQKSSRCDRYEWQRSTEHSLKPPVPAATLNFHSPIYKSLFTYFSQRPALAHTITTRSNNIMALVTISGYPCSGKSRRAAELAKYLETRLSDSTYKGPKLEVVTVNDEENHVLRSVYDGAYSNSMVCSGSRSRVSDSISEKPGRANIFAAVIRNLGPDKIVICDSLNYIKGFRYQMYCAAREAHVRPCTVSAISFGGLAGEADTLRYMWRLPLIPVENGMRSVENAHTSLQREYNHAGE
jgi:hypothetical protein